MLRREHKHLRHGNLMQISVEMPIILGDLRLKPRQELDKFTILIDIFSVSSILTGGASEASGAPSYSPHVGYQKRPNAKSGDRAAAPQKNMSYLPH